MNDFTYTVIKPKIPLKLSFRQVPCLQPAGTGSSRNPVPYETGLDSRLRGNDVIDPKIESVIPFRLRRMTRNPEMKRDLIRMLIIGTEFAYEHHIL